MKRGSNAAQMRPKRGSFLAATLGPGGVFPTALVTNTASLNWGSPLTVKRDLRARLNVPLQCSA